MCSIVRPESVWVVKLVKLAEATSEDDEVMRRRHVGRDRSRNAILTSEFCPIKARRDYFFYFPRRVVVIIVVVCPRFVEDEGGVVRLWGGERRNDVIRLSHHELDNLEENVDSAYCMK